MRNRRGLTGSSFLNICIFSLSNIDFREMSRVRQPSEWGIGRTKSLFSLLEFKVKHRIKLILDDPFYCMT
jgi:hypothetical protein